MADVTQTAANVGLSGAADVTKVQVGEAVTQGDVIRRDQSDNKYYLADTTTAVDAAAGGIALTPAATDGYVVIATSGPTDVGGTLVVGTTYVVSPAVAGNVAPIADIGTGDYVTVLGIASAADTLELDIRASGIASA